MYRIVLVGELKIERVGCWLLAASGSVVGLAA